MARNKAPAELFIYDCEGSYWTALFQKDKLATRSYQAFSPLCNKSPTLNFDLFFKYI